MVLPTLLDEKHGIGAVERKRERQTRPHNCTSILHEDRLKSSWTGGNAPLLFCYASLLHKSGALPAVHQLFKRPS